MKLQLLTAVAATALMAVPSLASANDQGWYVRGNVGYGSMTDVDFTGDLIGDVEGEGNVAGSVGLGYDFGNNWRLEFDGAQLWNDLGAITQASNTSAKMRLTTGMVNAIYDFDGFGSWEPYIGAGVGVARAALNASVHSFPNPSAVPNQILPPFNNPTCPSANSCVFDRKDTGTAWQLLAGLGYNINDNLTWDTQYRYLNAGDLDFTGLSANLAPPTLTTLGGGTDIATTASGAGAHILMTGLRYRFGGSKPPAPMYTCWDGSSVGSLANCPAEPPKIVYTTCWDGSQVESGTACPVEPSYACWDGSVAMDQAACPTRPTYTCPDNTIVYDMATCPTIVSLCANEYRQEIIYYNFDKGQSAETQEKIQRILDTGQYCNVDNINVVGHTDSSGAASYNMGLSNRRAHDVLDELVRQGIDSNIISSEGKGETQLFIDTGDGVKEQLNRRTEVLIQLSETGVVSN